jgi:mannan endo-1,4-beta-mannosidase
MDMPFRLEVPAPAAELAGGARLARDRAGYSGPGYVTGLVDDGDRVTFPFSVPAPGWYAVSLRYAADGSKRNRVRLDDLAYGDWVADPSPTFTAARLGAAKLEAGPHRLTIAKFWGHVDVDAVVVESIAAPAKPAPNFRLADQDPLPACRAVMALLQRLYGRRIIAGQHTSAAAGPEIAAVEAVTGKLPALRGFDLLSYSGTTATRHMNPDTIAELAANQGTVEAAIAWSRDRRGLVTICWHWFAPLGGTDKTFYTRNTDFDVRRACDPDTPEHAALLADIDRIAEALARLQDAGVPVLWRPLHEADGGWFWWGAHGPEPYLALYRLLFDRLVHGHGLHNLIWVWNAPDSRWYPGDAYVDIVGDDIYVGRGDYGPLAFAFQRASALVGHRKPVALTENGPIPDPDRLVASEAGWLWFMPWWGGGATYHGSSTEGHLRRVYGHPYVLTLDALQDAW